MFRNADLGHSSGECGLSVMKLGNVRGQTLRAYSVVGMEKVVEKVA